MKWRYYFSEQPMLSGIILYILVLASVIGCTSHAVSTQDLKSKIIVEPSTPKEVLAPWLFYAGIRAHWMEKKFLDRNPGAISYQYTFTEEVEARKGCAGLWREVRAKDGLTNRYLDDLVAVEEEDFLREYIWTYLKDVTWVQPEGLRLPEFDRWRSINLRDHRPETRAVARFEGK